MAILVSAIEHDSVPAAAPGAVRVPVKPSGVVDLEALDRLLAACERPALVSVMLANNETGVIQPIESVVALARTHGARIHCDAVQAAGRLPISVAELGVDLLTLSAHKLGGPQGVGALVAAESVELAPLLRGGGQERGRRAGTENVAAISGFGAAAAAALAGLNKQDEIGRLRDALEVRACAAVPGTIIFGRHATRLANTSCLAMPGPAAETQVMAFDLAGVAVSAGAACSSGKVRASHVLAAMGVDRATAGRAIRVSLSWQSIPADIDRFVETLTALARRWATLDNDRIILPAA
jgi:cysteine desulfurase